MAQSPSAPDDAFGVGTLLRDVRFIKIVGQIIFVLVVGIFITTIISNIFAALTSRNFAPNFDFLSNRAGFALSDARDYSSDDPYSRAFQVGVENTLRIVSVGLVMATVIGIVTGVLLLSSNFLLRSIARTYVEILRNTPLLIQLYAWYFIIILSLPAQREALQFPAEGRLPIPTRLAAYALIGVLLWRLRRQGTDMPNWKLFSSAALAGIAALEVGFWLLMARPAWVQSIYAVDPNVVWLAGGALVALVAAWAIGSLTAARLRWYAWGLVGGLWAASVVYHLGWITDGAAVYVELRSVIEVSNRGVVLPETVLTNRFAEWMAFVLIGVIGGVFLWNYYRRIIEETGQRIKRGRLVMALVLGCVVGGWVIVALQPVPEQITVEQDGVLVSIPLAEALENDLLDAAQIAEYSRYPAQIILPERSGLRYVSGTSFVPEYMALLLGLVVYTSAFIAEVVRAGIQAVPKGQIEASRALGFTQLQTLQMVILPQALRIIIPPMGNQYLNLTKNSSLAIAIAYTDLFQVSNTIINQSGQTVSMFVLIMGSYLVMSLTIAYLMNWLNGRLEYVRR